MYIFIWECPPPPLPPPPSPLRSWAVLFCDACMHVVSLFVCFFFIMNHETTENSCDKPQLFSRKPTAITKTYLDLECFRIQ